MSAEVSGWVWKNAPVKSGELVVLLALADNAHDDGTGAYPSQAHLAKKARMTERQVRNCLKALEENGLIRRQGTTAGGVIVWAVCMTGNVVPPGKDCPPGIELPSGGQSTSDRTVIEPPSPPPVRGRARAKRPDPDAIPDDFPDALREPLAAVMRSLTFVAESRGVTLPPRASVARAMMKPERQRKPFVAVAEKVEHWCVFGAGQSKPCKDVVARWRDWCDGEPDVARVGRGLAAVPTRSSGDTFGANLEAFHLRQAAKQAELDRRTG